MKRVLSLLIVFVFLKAQAWALSGGPFQSVGGSDIIGTYAGVLIPKNDFPRLNNQGVPTATSIGLFSFAQDQIGFASGVLVAFVDGTPLVGTLTGLIDPQDGHFQAVIDGESTYDLAFDLNNDGLVDFTTTLDVTGNMDADIKPTGDAGSSGVSSGFAATSLYPGLNAARVEGTAGLDLFVGLEPDGTPSVDQTVYFDVEGFKQSNDVTVATLPQFDFNVGNGGTGTGTGTDTGTTTTTP